MRTFSGISAALLLTSYFNTFISSIAQPTNASERNSNITNVELERLELPSARIVGGQNAAENQFPYQVSLQIEHKHTCGGSIISANYVVTAAHCVSTYSGRIIRASTLSIRAGTTRVNSGGVLIDVAQIIRHPKFLENNYDIALLHLSAPLTIGESIRAISLANAEPPAGAAVIISGWGRLSQRGVIPTHLQYNTLKYISRTQCQRQNDFVPQTIICLAHTAGNGACFGDSGGPAVYKEKLVGVANYVIKQCGSSSPDGYANVRYLRNWLKQNSDVN